MSPLDTNNTSKHYVFRCINNFKTTIIFDVMKGIPSGRNFEVGQIGENNLWLKTIGVGVKMLLYGMIQAQAAKQ